MKKLLLSFALFTLAFSSSAQCTPDPQFTDPGIYPDSATGFSAACVGLEYTQLITNVVPVDTCVQVVPFLPCVPMVFDSIVIVNFTGLPSSLSYDCNTSLGGCSFAGGQTGCAIINGTPTVADIGTHNLVITVDVYVGSLGTPSATQVIDWYFIEISDCGLGLGEAKESSLELYPNPATNLLTLAGLSETIDMVTITNINGQVMNVVHTNGAKSLDVNIEELSRGVYFVQFGDQNIRFVKQ